MTEENFEEPIPLKGITFDVVTTNQRGEVNLEDRRGYVLYLSIKLELLIDQLIVLYVKPAEKSFFMDIILSGKILDNGKKMKIIQAAELLSKSQIEVLRKISNIRNAFAHAPMFYVQKIHMDHESNTLKQSPVNHLVKTLDSQMKSKEEDPLVLFKEFYKNYQKASDFINDKIIELQDKK